MPRLGVDLLALQSPHSRGRGIGRYTAELLAALVTRGTDFELVYYTHDGRPTDELPRPEGVVVRPLPAGRSPASSIDRLVQLNPDGLDALLIPSPFEVGMGYAPPARALNGPALFAIVYDLVPFLFQERYLTWPPSATEFYRNLDRLARYDGLLAISDATRQDVLRLTGQPPERVVNIQAASDPNLFHPEPSPVQPRFDRPNLHELGIDRPYVLSVASTDQRKNLTGLLQAFSLLSEPVRRSHQLVIACHLNPADTARVREQAERLDIDSGLLLTGAVSDSQLVALYQGCASFAFPSTYEGFGLPLLEAMLCGAPVLAGANSSQPEVVGDAGLLVNVENPPEIARQLERLLTDPALAEQCRQRGLEQGRRFSWTQVADRLLHAVRDALPPVPARPGSGRSSAPGRRILHRAHPRTPDPAPVPPLRRERLRVGIDLLAVQSHGSRFRGIGRYVRSLLRELVTSPTLDLVLYEHEALSTEDAWWRISTRIERVPSHGPLDGRVIHTYFSRIASENPHDLDVLLLPSPFELIPGHALPLASRGRPALVTIVYDLIPFLHQGRYLTDPEIASWFHDRLATLCGYDRILTISDWTRDECLRHLGLSAAQVVSIGGASDPVLFHEPRSQAERDEAHALARSLGIDGPFVLTVASGDERKNVAGLLEAFGRLDPTLRQSHQLVVACGLDPADRDRIEAQAQRLGLAARLVLTGTVSDAQLRALYQTCTAFAFPSHEEGLGLPLLEAMHCGAPVLAGRNSSQPEVVGWAALLTDTRDPADLCGQLKRLLTDAPLQAQLRQAGPPQAARFSWTRVARSTEQALRAVARPEARASDRVRPRRTSTSDRPRVAMFTPLPPKRSGIATYAHNLTAHLHAHCRLDLYHDAGYVPHLDRQIRAACFDHRLFARRAARVGYDAVLYQVGNSAYHGFELEPMLRGGGVVILHDFNVPGLFVSEALQAGDPGRLEREIRHCEPDRAASLLAQLPNWNAEPRGAGDALAACQVALNRRILESAHQIIVHSPWSARRIAETVPEVRERVRLIPLGCRPAPPDPPLRIALRQRYDIAPEALVFGSLGFLHESKRSVETVEAFARLLPRWPDAVLVFAGEDLGAGAAPARALELGLRDRVRFLGRYPGDLAEVATLIDIGVSLRRPPSNGETSAALLDLLRSGVPTITSRVGTFADYPDEVVLKIDDHDEPVERIREAMHRLASDPDARAALGRNALAHIQAHHTWDRVALQYLDVIRAGSDRTPAWLGLSDRARRPGRSAWA